MKKIISYLFVSTIYMSSFAQANSDNHLDYIGSYHNQILEHVAQNTVNLSQLSLDQLNQGIVDALDGIASEDDIIRFRNNEYYGNFYAESDKFAFLKENGSISEEAFPYFNAMSEILEGASVTNYYSFYNSIVVVESSIINSDLSEGDKGQLLSAGSMFRYSTKYWFDQINDENSPWRTEDSTLNDTQCKYIIRNDVAFGAAGGIVGAMIGGTVSVGVLTIPGWVAGAFTGAATGSIGTAFLELFESLKWW